MVYCSGCGIEVKENQNYCTCCGSSQVKHAAGKNIDLRQERERRIIKEGRVAFKILIISTIVSILLVPIVNSMDEACRKKCEIAYQSYDSGCMNGCRAEPFYIFINRTAATFAGIAVFDFAYLLISLKLFTCINWKALIKKI